MNYIQDPILLAFLALLSFSAVVLLYPRQQLQLWLFLMTAMLFIFPRAGFLVPQINLPLPLAHVLAVLVICHWLLLGNYQSHQGSRFGYFFLLYAATAGLGLAIGMSTGGTYRMAFLEMFFYLASLGLFFYVSETFCERHHFLTFAGLILVFSVLISLYGIAQRYMGSSILVDHLTYNSASNAARSYIEIGQPGAAERRVLSSYGDPNVLVSQLLVFFGIALALVVGKRIPGRWRLVGLGVVAVNICCAIFTGSRAGMIALALVGLIVLAWRSRWALLILPIIVVLGGIFGPSLVDSVLEAKFQGLIPPEDIRAQFPAMAGQLFTTFPIGSGLGNMVTLQFEGFNWSFEVIPASNVWTGFNSYWLNLFSRLGVPGILSFLLLLLVLFGYIWHQSKRIAHPLVKAILIGAVAGCIGQGLIWLVNNTYMLPGGGLNFWFMMGIMVAGCRAFSEQSRGIPVMLGHVGGRMGMPGAPGWLPQPHFSR